MYISKPFGQNSLKVPHIIDPPARRDHLHSNGGFLGTGTGTGLSLTAGNSLEVCHGKLVIHGPGLPSAEELRSAVPAEGGWALVLSEATSSLFMLAIVTAFVPVMTSLIIL